MTTPAHAMTDAARSRTFSVVTYNIHKGFSGDGRRQFVLERMRAALATAAVDAGSPGGAGRTPARARRIDQWPSATQFEYLADTLGPIMPMARTRCTTRATTAMPF